MKVRIEVDDNLKDEDQEVVIRVNSLDQNVTDIQKAVAGVAAGPPEFIAYRDDREYYLPLSGILFFETGDNTIEVHTAKDMFHTAYKLYELEEILPGHFMRISKSAIVNVTKVLSVSRNLSSSSIIEFKNSHKKVYVSRHYYKPLKDKLEEKRNRI